MFDHSQDEFLHYRHLFAKDHMGMHDINQDQPLNPGTTNISEFSMLAQDKKDVKPAEAKKQPAKTEINKPNAQETEKPATIHSDKKADKKNEVKPEKK